MEDLEYEELLKTITKANQPRCFCFKRQIDPEVLERVNEKLDQNITIKLRMEAANVDLRRFTRGDGT